MDDARYDEMHSVRVVRLHSWSNDSLPISYFKEAFPSPCRDKILLQSEKYEAVLVSLHSTGNIPEEKMYKPLSMVRNSMSGLSNQQNIPNSSLNEGFEKLSEVPSCSDSSSITHQYSTRSWMNLPFILDSISCCWGAIGEGYSADRQVGIFKQMLFIVGKHGLFIHGFPKTRRKLDQVYKDQTRGDKVKAPPGRWINWGVDNFDLTSDISNRDPLLSDEAFSEMQSKSFITYLVDSQVQKVGDVAHLVFVGGKSQLPIGKIISYSIQYHSTSFSKLIEHFQEQLCRSGKNDKNALEDFINVSIGKVFSGSSFDMIGMLFHVSDNSAVDFAEGNAAKNGRCSFFISICRISQSGLEWFSVIEPNKALMQSTASQWPTFSITGSYLFGLHEEGYICIWSIVDATIVVNIDVLQHCDLHDVSQRSMVKQDLHQATIKKLREKNLSKKHFSRKFLRMDMAPDSSLIAVTDSLALIYVLSVDHYLSHYLDPKNTESRYFPPKSLSSLAVGSRVIGSLTPQFLRENTSSGGVSLVSGLSSSNHSSGFSSKSNLGRLGVRATNLKSNPHHPVRQVLLPMNYSNFDLTVSLNPFGVTEMINSKKEPHEHTIFLKTLQLSGETFDEKMLKKGNSLYMQMHLDPQREKNILPFSSLGYLFFLQDNGLHVVLPPVSASTSKLPDSLEGRWWFTGLKYDCTIDGAEACSGVKKPRTMLKQWQIEVLDKILIYDGLVEAEAFAAENGWSQQVVRLRRLQLALDYAQLNEIQQALDSLVHVGAADIGIPRVLFCAQELIVKSSSGDNEFGQASRLLSLLAQFVIKLIKQYGMQQYGVLSSKNYNKNDLQKIQKKYSSLPHMSYNLHEMSRFLEVTRKMQSRLQIQRGRPQAGKNDEVAADSGQGYGSQSQPSPGSEQASAEDEFSKPEALMWLVGAGENGDKSVFESSHEMFYRWEKGNINLPEIVREALRAGRLPLAVVQLHRLQSKDLVSQMHRQNVFKEVQLIGRAFVYELFCKGEASKAMIALSRLGEDVEMVLRELAFGTVSRVMRSEIINELAKLGCLDFQDLKILETISILERAYPSSSFWLSYGMHQRALPDPTRTPSEPGLVNVVPQLVCSLNEPEDFRITCGEAHGVVLGDWNGANSLNITHSSLEDLSPAYWAGAAVWLKVWDKRTFDRVCIDQETLVVDTVSWEARLQAAISRNDAVEVSFLLDSIPDSALSEGELRVRLDCPDSPVVDYDHETRAEKISQDGSSALDLDAVETVIPSVRFLSVELGTTCTSWISQMIEEKVAKSYIFLRSYWHGTTQLISLLARAGMLCDNSDKGFLGGLQNKTKQNKETEQAIHELVLRHCARHTLPNFMGIYLDHHSLALDTMSSVVMQAVVGYFQHWALWLLSSRTKGNEYEMSFANARTILAHNFKPGHLAFTTEIEDFIVTVDDMAMIGGEMMALSTLMYAPMQLEKCLCTGSVTRCDGSSWKCTLENLQPMLQQYPTLWRTLLAVCLTPNTWWFTSLHQKSAASMRTQPGVPGYLQWREKIFSSACGDTSLLEMMPHWFPKGVRQLIRLTIQGPVGSGQSAFQGWDENTASYSRIIMNENDPIAWENIIRKCIEDELYASSKLEDRAVGIDHHIERGRALAAFNSLLALRLQNFNVQGSMIREHVGKFQRGQLHMSSELHAVLSPLSHEEKYLTNVLPLAIMNFENPVVVAAASSFLELCGFPAIMLRVDVAVLSRISSFCKFKGSADIHEDFSIMFENDLAGSLARVLADEYREAGVAVLLPKKINMHSNGKPSKILLTILQILEKASLMEAVENDASPGAWLFNGMENGSELRHQQWESSERWSLVTTFCNVHQLPVSTAYLTVLARDNDWVGFLAEAQTEGCPLEVVISVASREFTDSRLRSHILTVLKTLQTAWQKAPTTEAPVANEPLEHETKNVATPSELFQILANCEQKKCPGTALLAKAKDMRWPLLAVVSSCFTDVTPIACLTVWLEITAARETSSIKVSDAAAQITTCVGAAVEATNGLTANSRGVDFQYNRRSPKRRRLQSAGGSADTGNVSGRPEGQKQIPLAANIGMKADVRKTSSDFNQKMQNANGAFRNNALEEQESLSKMVVVFCEQQRFFPLLKGFELFIPSSSLLPFIRFLQAFSQMRLSEASTHLALFSARVKEEYHQAHYIPNRSAKTSIAAWISVSAVTAADTILTSCPSPYEQRCLLELLSSADFGDGGAAATRFRRLYQKIQLAEPALQKGLESMVYGASLDDDALLLALESQGKWEQARSWAQQLEPTGRNAKAMHHVTETQAEAMVAEWREFLWDIPEERIALWKHCHELFLKHSLPSLQGGLFFLKHADEVEREVSPLELHGILLLALQWLSGQITNTPPKYPVHRLCELETRIWLLAVGKSEVETQSKKASLPSWIVTGSRPEQDDDTASVTSPEPIHYTAKLVSLVDNHLRSSQARSSIMQSSTSTYQEKNSTGLQEQEMVPKHKRRPRNYVQHKKTQADKPTKLQLEQEDISQGGLSPAQLSKVKGNYVLQDDVKEDSVPGEENTFWEERVGEQQLGQAVLSLLEVGQMSAARQLQQKLAPTHVPIELLLVETALVIAELSTPTVKGCITPTMIPSLVVEHLLSSSLLDEIASASPLEVLEVIAKACPQGCGRGSCERIKAVAQIADFLGLSFGDAFEKSPAQLLQLLSLKAQDSFAEAKMLVETHSMHAVNIARILAESFLKGLLAAHRGGFMESAPPEEGPSPLLWRPSDFLKWAELCKSEAEMGHALMHIVLSGHDVPNICEVELLVCAYGFYMSSSCLSGIDVLLTLASTRVESYLFEGDFISLARLVTGINNFQSLHFILDILIENEQLELLLQKRAAVEAAMESSASVRGFRMAVLSTLKHFNPHDLDAFGKVFKQFDMKHEMAALVESRARAGVRQFDKNHVLEQSDELLEMMRYNVEAAEVWASVDAGKKARWNCAQASLISLQIRIPEVQWLNLTETNARRLFVEQSRFEEALVVAEAYNLNQPSEWAPVIWDHMQNPGWIEPFLGEFVAALPLPANMLMELARFYRAEVTGRKRNIDFSTWLSPGGLPLEWAKYLEKSFRCLLKYVCDVKLRVQLATLATGFPDVLEICMRILDKVPETAGPLILRKAHGGGYLPLM